MSRKRGVFHKRILIIDDDREVAEVLAEYLHSLNYSTEIVDKGFEGLKRLRCKEYYAVFSDLRMPDIKGDEILMTLKNEGNKISKRFIIVTGALLESDEEFRIKKIGGRIMRKPFVLEDIQKVLSLINNTLS
jgi:CheY-like chemotaxis protein